LLLNLVELVRLGFVEMGRRRRIHEGRRDRGVGVRCHDRLDGASGCCAPGCVARRGRAAGAAFLCVGCWEGSPRGRCIRAVGIRARSRNGRVGSLRTGWGRRVIRRRRIRRCYVGLDFSLAPGLGCQRDIILFGNGLRLDGGGGDRSGGAYGGCRHRWVRGSLSLGGGRRGRRGILSRRLAEDGLNRRRRASDSTEVLGVADGIRRLDLAPADGSGRGRLVMLREQDEKRSQRKSARAE
jgi:hypothetical protein